MRPTAARFLNHQFLVAAAAPEWNQALPQNAPRLRLHPGRERGTR